MKKSIKHKLSRLILSDNQQRHIKGGDDPKPKVAKVTVIKKIN